MCIRDSLSDAYQVYGYNRGDFPVSEKISQEVLSLPMHTELDVEQIEYICETIKEFVLKQISVIA